MTYEVNLNIWVEAQTEKEAIEACKQQATKIEPMFFETRKIVEDEILL